MYGSELKPVATRFEPELLSNTACKYNLLFWCCVFCERIVILTFGTKLSGVQYYVQGCTTQFLLVYFKNVLKRLHFLCVLDVGLDHREGSEAFCALRLTDRDTLSRN